MIDYQHIRLTTTNYQRITCLGGSLFFNTSWSVFVIMNYSK